MDVRYAPDDVKLGDRIVVGAIRGRKAEVIEIGQAVVIVRYADGYTITLLRKRVSHPARNRPWKKPANVDAAPVRGV